MWASSTAAVAMMFVVAHLRMVRPAYMSWLEFTRAVRSQLNPRIGAILMHSQSTGKVQSELSSGVKLEIRIF